MFQISCRLPRKPAADASIDLALLKADIATTTPLSFRREVRVGETIFVYGFPLAGFLATTGNFTSGNVTANAGVKDDSTKLQISAPVQPGNSGAPLLDEFGNIVGIVVAQLDALKFAGATGDIVQNVNFAIKASIAIAFLERHGVRVKTIANTRPLVPADIAEQASAAAMHIVCK